MEKKKNSAPPLLWLLFRDVGEVVWPRNVASTQAKLEDLSAFSVQARPTFSGFTTISQIYRIELELEPFVFLSGPPGGEFYR